MLNRIPIPAFNRLRQKYGDIIVIVSPPRCSSTAFARVFWEHPAVGYYAHEPFEVMYYADSSLTAVIDKLDDPLELRGIKKRPGNGQATNLVIKEMPYQVGSRFSNLVSLATKPILFLMRDPRLNIASRMAKKREVGDDPLFPQVESGWELLAAQIRWCRERQIPHLIVDSADFCNHPKAVFKQLFDSLQLPFSEDMLTWRSRADVEIDNLNGRHHHLYRHVMSSSGIEPTSQSIPSVDSFPKARGFRQHVIRSLEIYKTLRRDPARIQA